MRNASRIPQMRELPDGNYALNAPGFLRMFYEIEENEFTPGEGLELWRRFKAKADAAIATERLLTGREPDLQEVLNRVFDIERFTAAIARDNHNPIAALRAAVGVAS